MKKFTQKTITSKAVKAIICNKRGKKLKTLMSSIQNLIIVNLLKLNLDIDLNLMD